MNAAYGARKPKLIQKEFEILDENQVLQFLIAAQDDRYEALYHVAIKTGMRQGELLGLEQRVIASTASGTTCDG